MSCYPRVIETVKSSPFHYGVSDRKLSKLVCSQHGDIRTFEQNGHSQDTLRMIIEDAWREHERAVVYSGEEKLFPDQPNEFPVLTDQALNGPLVQRSGSFNGPSSQPQAGQIMYDSMTGQYRVFDGRDWLVMGPSTDTAIWSPEYHPPVQAKQHKPEEPPKPPAKPKKLWARKIV